MCSVIGGATLKGSCHSINDGNVSAHSHLDQGNGKHVLIFNYVYLRVVGVNVINSHTHAHTHTTG